eukprot:Tamp_12656.p1 GENE.Tamp_12656~~Tamp_12656.p1  ORF type:complete len:510 (+),score=50.71 Tamp_12656:71-1531(+)
MQGALVPYAQGALVPYSPSGLAQQAIGSLPPLAWHGPQSSPGQPQRTSQPPMPAPVTSPPMRVRRAPSGGPRSSASPVPQAPTLLRSSSFGASATKLSASPLLLKDVAKDSPPPMQRSKTTMQRSARAAQRSAPPRPPSQGTDQSLALVPAPESDTARKSDVISNPAYQAIAPEEMFRMAPSRARAQRSAAPPPAQQAQRSAASPPTLASDAYGTSTGGDASVSNIAYTTSSFVRRMMDPHAGGDATADFNMYGVSSQQGVEDALQSVDPFAAAQTPLRGTKDRRERRNMVLESIQPTAQEEAPRAFEVSMPQPKPNEYLEFTSGFSHWPGEEHRPVVMWGDSGTTDPSGNPAPNTKRAKDITVWVLDMAGRKHPIRARSDDDILGLRNKIMRLPWIKSAEAAWTIHGGTEIILTRKALNKWTGKYETLILENGDGFEHTPTRSCIEDGTVIEPVFDDAAYGLSALAVDVKGMFGQILRGTPVEAI